MISGDRTIRDAIRRSVPWWAKGAAKLALARLPLRYQVLRRLSIARHGGMGRPAFAYDTFRRHFDAADFHRKAGGFTVLELGPGDSLFTALTARAHGASAVWLVDVAFFASIDMAAYRAMADFLQQRGLSAPDLRGTRSIGNVLSSCNACYGVDGLASLRAIPDGQIDFAFSNTVLQHVALEEFGETLRELRRVMHGGGCCVHSVDLRDMFAQSLHHLRFPARVWESRSFRNSGFYTNRMRLSPMLDAFRRAGFSVEVVEANRWPGLPIARGSLAPPYSEMAEDELLVRTARVVCRPIPVRTGNQKRSRDSRELTALTAGCA